MNFIKKIFCKRKQFKLQPRQLRIDGCKATLTPTPDDAELAAQALLESRIYGDKTQRKAAKKRQPSDFRHQTSSTHDAQYYQELSDRIKLAHEHDARMATRYVAYVEEQLKDQPADIATLEYGLFKHQNTVEREGGELLKRWQKCLAECLVKQMVHDKEESPAEGAENADNTNTDSKE